MSQRSPLACRLISLLILCTTALSTHADHKPLWELQAGLGMLQIPYYRGSASKHNYILPIPTFIYRGEYIKASEDGVKGLLYSSDRFKLDISMAMSFAASSDENGARAGMPKLEPTLEVGPSLITTLWRSENKQSGLWFKLPLRMTFSFDDFNIRDQGLITSPTLFWQHKRNAWKWGISLGVSYADENYHDYFYGVEERYVTDTRTEYNASAGYSGQHVSLSVTKHAKQSWFGAFVRAENLKGTVFDDSPLVEQNDYLVFGILYTRLVAKSKRGSVHSEHEID